MVQAQERTERRDPAGRHAPGDGHALVFQQLEPLSDSFRRYDSREEVLLIGQSRGYTVPSPHRPGLGPSYGR